MTDFVEIYVLNEKLETVGLVDAYTSLIWAKRYNDDGDCELCVEATSENLKLLRKNYYLFRNDDDMVCQIKTIELDTDVENGNVIIVTAYDIKRLLAQRVIWKQINFKGTVENYIRKIINQNVIDPADAERQIPYIALGVMRNFPESIDEQVTYDNVKDKVQELCKSYDYGYRLYLSGSNFIVDLYKGRDKSKLVIFSEEFENLISTKYIDDSNNYANVALVGGEGEGSNRTKTIVGDEEGLNRYEMFVDAKDISRTISWDDLIAKYPAGTVITEGDKIYYVKEGIRVAELSGYSSGSYSNVRLLDSVYIDYLKNKGFDLLAEHTALTSFEGSIEPSINFRYKYDYDLGDIVLVANNYGLSIKARIVEIIEVFDENGYSVEPKFEYKYETMTNSILTEDGDTLSTEDGDFLALED